MNTPDLELLPLSKHGKYDCGNSPAYGLLKGGLHSGQIPAEFTSSTGFITFVTCLSGYVQRYSCFFRNPVVDVLLGIILWVIDINRRS